jgi:hypothetical protein
MPAAVLMSEARMLGMTTVGGLGGQRMLPGQPACQGSTATGGCLGSGAVDTVSTG